MKQRSLWKMFLLEIVTLGIYRLYFLIKTRREIMNLKPDVKIKSPAFLLLPIGVMVAAIVFFFVAIASSAPSAKNCGTSLNSPASQSSNLFNDSSTQVCSSGSALPLVAILVFYAAIFLTIILVVVWEWSYSHGVEAITDAKLSFALSLIILILVPDGIDILIIQDYFNKVALSPVGGIPQAAPMAPVAPVPPTLPTIS